MFATGDWVQIDLEAYGKWYREAHNAPMLFQPDDVFKVVGFNEVTNDTHVRAYGQEPREYHKTGAWVPARFIHPL